ncbi:MAG: LON peptidase substrate-binding domain-containing protein [Opitutaceae bacterium]|nr:LON peptidase substrate-binding domain-containing protein [Verrucomicrobiales bacterium]
MEIPGEVAVMTLSNATLFPQALLPLYIFEPRYRRMLADALRTHRMFSVAMQKPGRIRETPSTVAGLGLVRVSVDNADGTSHLILQGITRVELVGVVQYKPYRVHRIRPLVPSAVLGTNLDSMVATVRNLVTERIEMGFPPGISLNGKSASDKSKKAGAPSLSAQEIICYLEKMTDPDQVADLVSCAMLSGPVERQTILETVDVEARLKHLIRFLLTDINQHRNALPP